MISSELPLEADSVADVVVRTGGVVAGWGAAGAAGAVAGLWAVPRVEVFGVVLGAVAGAGRWETLGAGAGVGAAEVVGVAGVVGAAGAAGAAGVAGAALVGVPGGGANTAASTTPGSARTSTADRHRAALSDAQWIIDRARIAWWIPLASIAPGRPAGKRSEPSLAPGGEYSPRAWRRTPRPTP
jgi:hypothetical protein